MEKVIKTFRVDVKEVDAENGTMDMMIPMSTSSVDRDGDIIEPTAFRKTLPSFRKRPILLSSHDYRSLQSQIGEFTNIKVTEEGLLAKPKYYINEGNPEADWAFNLASKGIAAFSVGFTPEKSEPLNELTDSNELGSMFAPKRFTQVELLEVSQVVVPSNRDAIMGERSKGFDNPVALEIAEEVLADEDFVFEDKGELVGEHKEKETSQKELADEMDFLIARLEDSGLNDEAKEVGLKLASLILRSTGDDIPDDIIEKVGAALSKQNKVKLEQIIELAQNVIDSAKAEEPEEEDEPVEEKTPELEKSAVPTAEEIAKLVGVSVRDELDRLRGKI